ncbi:MAG: hypothetical protein R3E70_15575 [Burkholderiaceae bacterium]
MGVFHACRILVQPINTLIGATDSVDKPRAARALAQDGFVGMRRVLGRSLTVLLALGLPYLLIIAATASWLLPWLLGEAYRGQTHVVTWWCAVALAMLIAQPVESGLYVTRRVRQDVPWAASRVGARSRSGLAAGWALGRCRRPGGDGRGLPDDRLGRFR